MTASRRTNGKYAKSWERFLILPIFLALLALGAYFWHLGSLQEPLIGQPDYIPVVRAVESVANTADLGLPPTTVDQMIENEFGEFGPEVVEQAKKVAFCESGKQAHNWNGKFMGVTAEQADAEGRAVGVFQIYRKVHKKYSFDSLLDGQYNVFIAKQMYIRSKWRPWLASYKCHGLK